MNNLINLAIEIIHFSFIKHCVNIACVIETASGKIFTGVNLRGVASGPCAEAVALANAFKEKEYDLKYIVAIHNNGEIQPPCGNCRQLLIDYAPNIEVILGPDKTVQIENLLGYPYISKYDLEGKIFNRRNK